MPSSNLPNLLERMAAAVPEQRRELGISITALAKLSGVSRPTVVKIDRGRPVRPDKLLAVARELTMLEVYALPAPAPTEKLVDDLATVVRETPAPTVLEWPPLPGEPWPAGSAA